MKKMEHISLGQKREREIETLFTLIVEERFTLTPVLGIS